ncbi:MAG: oxaloacetate-decarboxylating malate dehydrogenase, partial [Actinobacteria bacterium]|nr:oxaloacetate-decarboxylating malate dehydrogenase [Actinomycetota bacterium]
PVVLDVGTDNLGLLNSDLYLGERHARVRGERYDAFIELFVQTVTRLFPNAMLHWEDFGAGNAHRILQRYSGSICTFNDDIQGTAAVVLAAVLAAVRLTGVPLPEHRVVIHGAGTAGVGIADLIREAMARAGTPPEDTHAAFYTLNSRGLVVEDSEGVRDFQRPYARTRAEVAGWTVADPDRITLEEVVREVRPTILIGTSARHGAFSEEVVTTMAAHCERPIIMPLSNPTSRSEAHPADVLAWTDGRALIATGSPFGTIRHGETYHTIAQANNALIFPGLGLGVSVVRATRVSDEMIYAAADALAGLMNEYRPGASLLPSMSDLRVVAATVAKAVAETAERQGLARRPMTNPINDIYQRMWKPEYPRLEILPARA